MLRQRQELFCLGVIQGKTAQQAYIDAGYSKASSSAGALQILRNTKVQNRIQELRNLSTSKAVMDVIELKERLTDIIRNGEHKDAVKAADVLNRMLGTYAPTQSRSQIDSRVAVAAQITVVSPQARSMVERILNGERTTKLLGETNPHIDMPSHEEQVESQAS